MDEIYKLEKEMKHNKVESFPLKEDVLKILKEENMPFEDQKYNQLILLLEFKKIEKNVGIIKGEYYQKDKLEYRGSLLLPLTNKNEASQSIFDSLDINESRFFGFTLDSREPNLSEKAINFFKRSFEDATIQNFIPFVGGSRKE